jgi:NADP+-dependent farnesol dehydrogenase
MDHWKDKAALVTGASAGIGAEIVRQLAKNGIKVIAAARRLDKLQELATGIKREFNVDIYPMRCDVKEEEDILKTFKWADEKLGGVDVLINNAAVLYKESIIGKLLLFTFLCFPLFFILFFFLALSL